MSAYRRMQIDSHLPTCSKFKSNWIKDLNTKSDTLNLKEEKVGNNLECIDTQENFLDIESTGTMNKNHEPKNLL